MSDSNTIPLDPNAPDDPGDSMQGRQTWISKDDHQALYDILSEFEYRREGIDPALFPALARLRRFVENTYRDAS